MPIYTRTGDDGTTGLIGGARTTKDDLQIATYGTVDELNSALGLARTGAPEWADTHIEAVQSELFVIGSHLALAEGQSPHDWALPSLAQATIRLLETQIDAAAIELPPLRNFILPGGTELAARLHVARTVCRRAERLAVTFARGRSVDPLVVAYLNRLGDWLFTLARLANHRAGVPDVPWVSR